MEIKLTAAFAAGVAMLHGSGMRRYFVGTALALMFSIAVGATPVQSAVIYTTMDGDINSVSSSGLGFSIGDSFSLIFSYDDTAETDSFRYANGTDYAVQTYDPLLVGGSGSFYNYEVTNFTGHPYAPYEWSVLQIVHAYPVNSSPILDEEWAGNNFSLITNYPGPDGYGSFAVEDFQSHILGRVGVTITSVFLGGAPAQPPPPPSITAVPEPATWGMMLVGFFGVGFMMRGARRKGALAVG